MSDAGKRARDLAIGERFEWGTRGQYACAERNPRGAVLAYSVQGDEKGAWSSVVLDADHLVGAPGSVWDGKAYRAGPVVGHAVDASKPDAQGRQMVTVRIGPGALGRATWTPVADARPPFGPFVNGKTGVFSEQPTPHKPDALRAFVERWRAAHPTASVEVYGQRHGELRERVCRVFDGEPLPGFIGSHATGYPDGDADEIGVNLAALCAEEERAKYPMVTLVNGRPPAPNTRCSLPETVAAPCPSCATARFLRRTECDDPALSVWKCACGWHGASLTAPLPAAKFAAGAWARVEDPPSAVHGAIVQIVEVLDGDRFRAVRPRSTKLTRPTRKSGCGEVTGVYAGAMLVATERPR